MGILDFMQTPEGLGLVSGLAGYAANARRNQPINSIGRGLAAGVMGYGSAKEQNAQLEQMKQMGEMRQMQMDQVKLANEQRLAQQQALSSAPEDIRNAVAMGVPFSEIWKRQNPEAKWVDGLDSQGRPVKGWATPQGFQQIGGAQAKPVEWKDVGGKLFAADPYSGMPTGQTIVKTMTPGEQASNSLGWANNKLGWANYSKPSIQNVEGAGMFAVSPNGQASPITVGGKPIVSDKPLTESQGAALNFGVRAAKANEQINQLEADGTNKPGAIKRMAESIPVIGGGMGTMTNWTQSGSQQRVEQAQRDFITAVLRKESGATIQDSEFDSAKRQYFPQPGDSAEVIKQKAENRKTAVEGLAYQAGSGAGKVRDSARPVIPQDAANELKMRKADPQARKQFDEVFGEGAADRVLGVK